MLDRSEDLIEEIEQRVLEQGFLSKAEIVVAWQLDEDTYERIKQAILQRGRLDSGRRRSGGFQAKRERGPLPAGVQSSLLLEQWEETVTQRLTELLTHKDLEELLGGLSYTVRESRRLETGENRRGSKAELAAALVIQHGQDLLAVPGIREVIARACKAEFPRRWHPGKASAVEFVARIGFPSRLAGLPRDESPPDYEYLESRYNLPQLLDFQREVHAELTQVIRSGKRAIVSLPTGAGKTRVAVEAIRDWLTEVYDPQRKLKFGDDVLWLAHTEELCEQAYACFKQVWGASANVSPLFLARFWGDYLNDFRLHRATLRRVLDSPSVLISTPQRVVNLLRNTEPDARAVVNILRETLGLLLVDEAHRAGAPSYRYILEELVPRARDVSVVGLTATPFRMVYEPDQEAGTKQLKAVFGKLIEPAKTVGGGDDLRGVLVQRKVLAEPLFVDVETRATLRVPDVPEGDDVTIEQLEHFDEVLATHADTSVRRLRILESIIEIARDPANSILYFGPRVRDAECMAYLLRERKIPAAVVSAKTRDETRRALIERFRRNELRVLCNCEVLTTGFDAPKVTHIVMARPTISQVLYEQMVGRGLRGPKFGGTATCTILDCIDEFRGKKKPELGYTRFRDVWKRRRQSASLRSAAN
jgi:superfamily II DNA or RNA helicase